MNVDLEGYHISSVQIWEPAIGHLLCSPAAKVIDEIWAWESVHHGDAGLINAAKASAVCEFVSSLTNFLILFYFL